MSRNQRQTVHASVQAPVHGGDLSRAKRAYPEQKQWLDLSAGLNPNPWPVPDIPQHCFQQLPDGYDALLSVAADYYQHEQLCPLNGSQQGIELLPVLYQIYQQEFVANPGCLKRVAVPIEGYAEHAWCWQKAGFQVFYYRATTPEALSAWADSCDILVVINPNNPTAQCFSRETLLACHQILADKDGWLIVDEAFVDAFDDTQRALFSVADKASDSLLVLRSIGKFFGLAGIRSGFLLTGECNLNLLRRLLGPWSISGVTAWLTEQMLRDTRWQTSTRMALADTSDYLAKLLECFLVNEGVVSRSSVIGKTPLFVSLLLPGSQPTEDASGKISVEEIQQRLAEQGVWVRCFNYQGSPDRYFNDSGRLRFGLPKSNHERDQLTRALVGMRRR